MSTIVTDGKVINIQCFNCIFSRLQDDFVSIKCSNLKSEKYNQEVSPDDHCEEFYDNLVFRGLSSPVLMNIEDLEE
jgi:hypothetical protein